MVMLTHIALQALLLSQVAGHGLHRRANPLDTYPRNTIPTHGGPTLYYNGTGPVPGIDTLSPLPEPLSNLSTQQISAPIVHEIAAVASQSNNCTACTDAVQVLHIAALATPQNAMTDILVDICETLGLTTLTGGASCQSYFSGTGGLGPYFAQLLRKMSVTTGDHQAFCHYTFSVCHEPPLVAINESDWFPPKPVGQMSAPEPSGKTINVFHFSDWHLDPRFDIGAEANCTSGLCCRFDAINEDLSTSDRNASLPASRFGDFLCDTPPDLGLSAFSSMRQEVDFSSVAFSIFTGDVVSHDQTNQESRALSAYEEGIAYDTFRAQLGPMIPVYPTLGNHDSWPSGFNTPNSFRNDSEPNTFAWNYEHVSTLWGKEGWVNGSEQHYASAHYGAYAHTTQAGLRIVSINSDFWYTPNVFNFYNYTNPDKSGILRFLTNELLAAEAADQRVWIIGHVPSGGSSAAGNPSVLFHSIVARFSPATIAGVFFGHTHKDEKQLFYDFASPTNSSSVSTLRNYTDLNYDVPLMVGWVGASIVPLTNYNAGWSVYEVDSETFEVVNAQVYFANISNSLQWSQEPEWEFEYDARSIYDPDCQWPATAPLNATFWSGVTEKMMSNDSLIQEYLFLSTKQSAMTPSCAGSCLSQSICHIRSGNRATYEACS